jgi:hypothetical protein
MVFNAICNNLSVIWRWALEVNKNINVSKKHEEIYYLLKLQFRNMSGKTTHRVVKQ